MPVLFRLELGLPAQSNGQGPSIEEQLSALPEELVARAFIWDKRTEFVYLPVEIFEKHWQAVMSDWFDVALKLAENAEAGIPLALDHDTLRLFCNYPLVLWTNWTNGNYLKAMGARKAIQEMHRARIIVRCSAERGGLRPIIPTLHPSFVEFLFGGPDYRTVNEAIDVMLRGLYEHWIINKARDMFMRYLVLERPMGSLVLCSVLAVAALLRPILLLMNLEAIAMEGTCKTFYMERYMDPTTYKLVEARLVAIAWWPVILTRGVLKLQHLFHSARGAGQVGQSLGSHTLPYINQFFLTNTNYGLVLEQMLKELENAREANRPELLLLVMLLVLVLVLLVLVLVRLLLLVLLLLPHANQHL
ncbi:hypothetical protein GPECTOR_159g112 [Gonium pectorale]|uniref:Uncharacterized protein n=1 Tax=Gonium pectorale TaxID=33097 RepID=A0A150FXJ1_GONPE|nr:hypothetical protein GPECTOR_159g112 [Gonium pectorale]|eukprot:KXZ42344.1 hypothetical protein GPECTOR_159g112 [Gonium pectorale]